MARGSSYGGARSGSGRSLGGSRGGLTAPMNPSWAVPNLTVSEEGTALTATAGSINFVGAGVTATASGTDVTVTVTGAGSYTDEEAQDAVGTILVDGTTIDFTYTDATPSITAEVKPASITEAMQVLADNTTQDVSTTKHGYVPKAPNDTSKFLRGDGTWTTVSGGGGSSVDISPFSDGNITKPSTSTFSIADDTTANHGIGTSANLSSRGVTLIHTQSGTPISSQSLFYVAAVSSTLISATTFVQPNWNDRNSNWFYGLAVRDNAAKIHAFGVRNSGTGTTYSDFRYTTVSAVSTTVNQTGGNFALGNPIWLRLALVSTNFVFSVSFDGENFFTVETISATTFVAATLNDVGIFMVNNMGLASHPMNLNCFSFVRT